MHKVEHFDVHCKRVGVTLGVKIDRGSELLANVLKEGARSGSDRAPKASIVGSHAEDCARARFSHAYSTQPPICAQGAGHRS